MSEQRYSGHGLKTAFYTFFMFAIHLARLTAGASVFMSRQAIAARNAVFQTASAILSEPTEELIPAPVPICRENRERTATGRPYR